MYRDDRIYVVVGVCACVCVCVHVCACVTFYIVEYLTAHYGFINHTIIS